MATVEDLPREFDSILLNKVTVQKDIEKCDLRDKIRKNVARGNALVDKIEEVRKKSDWMRDRLFDREMAEDFVKDCYTYERAAMQLEGRCNGDANALNRFRDLKLNEQTEKNNKLLTLFERTDDGYSLRPNKMRAIEDFVEEHNRTGQRILSSDITFSYIINDNSKDTTKCFDAPCATIDIANKFAEKYKMLSDACSVTKDGKQLQMFVGGVEVPTEEKPKVVKLRSSLVDDELPTDELLEDEDQRDIE